MIKNRIQKICETCGNSFETIQAEADRRFCSHSCYHKSMVHKVEKTCENCGEMFLAVYSKKDTKRFCSKACNAQSKMTRVTKTCETCNNPFEVIQAKKDARYCSTTCAGIAKIRQIEKVCERCGKTFMVIPARANARHCSKECQTNRVEKTCNYCGNTFFIKASHAHLRGTCSRSCNAHLRAKEKRSPNQGRVRSDTEKERLSQKVSAYFDANPTKHNWYMDGSHAKGKQLRGPSWNTQRKLARARDKYTCQVCGIAETELGKKLSVHHITPYRKFSSSEEANALENLICVCQPCHMKLEHNTITITRS